MFLLLSVLFFSVNVFASFVMLPKNSIPESDFSGSSYGICDEKCRKEKLKSGLKKVALFSFVVVSSVVFYKFYYIFLGNDNCVNNIDEQSYDDMISYLV
jgi:hypothetical protein